MRNLGGSGTTLEEKVTVKEKRKVSVGFGSVNVHSVGGEMRFFSIPMLLGLCALLPILKVGEVGATLPVPLGQPAHPPMKLVFYY